MNLKNFYLGLVESNDINDYFELIKYGLDFDEITNVCLKINENKFHILSLFYKKDNVFYNVFNQKIYKPKKIERFDKYFNAKYQKYYVSFNNIINFYIKIFLKKRSIEIAKLLNNRNYKTNNIYTADYYLKVYNKAKNIFDNYFEFALYYQLDLPKEMILLQNKEPYFYFVYKSLLVKENGVFVNPFNHEKALLNSKIGDSFYKEIKHINPGQKDFLTVYKSLKLIK